MTQNTSPFPDGERQYFVSTDWLSQRLEHVRDGRLLLIETGAAVENGAFRSTLYEYAGEGHIPGAVYADLLFQFSDADSPLGFTRPQTLQFQNAAAQLGLTPETQVVIYDRAQGEWASRLAWLFAAWGHRQVRVLDGGWLKWKATGGAQESGINKPASQPRGAHFADYDERFFASTEEVRQASQSGDARLICGLPEAVYRGEAGNYARKGHIPGSINLPYTAWVAEDNTLGRPFDAPAPEDRTIVYCGAGIISALLALKLREAGQQNIAVYDGSLREWTADASLPLVLGA